MNYKLTYNMNNGEKHEVFLKFRNLEELLSNTNKCLDGDYIKYGENGKFLLIKTSEISSVGIEEKAEDFNLSEEQAMFLEFLLGGMSKKDYIYIAEKKFIEYDYESNKKTIINLIESDIALEIYSQLKEWLNK